MKTADGLNNMALAHEIAVNDEFKVSDEGINVSKTRPYYSSQLEKPQLPPESLKAKVTVQMRKAFFDKLKEELQEGEYEMALGLLEEIKEVRGKSKRVLKERSDARRPVATTAQEHSCANRRDNRLGFD